MNLQIKFGSYDISADANIDISEFQENSDTRISEHRIARRDGAIIDIGRLSPIEVKIRGDVLGSTVSGLRTNWDLFTKYVFNQKQKLYLFSDRYIADAQSKEPNSSYASGYLKRSFSLTFISGTPFWLAETASQDVKVISASPTSWAVTMAGSAYAKPKITFAADQGVALSNISFENVTGDKTLSYLGTVEAGNSLVIDCDDDKMTVENDGVSDLENFTGHFWELLSGANTVKYTGQNCTITIDWRDRWF